MSTRNFIRHLEPYGYIDQKKYDKFGCGTGVDLSDLKEDSKDVNDRIDDLCERQSRINNEFNRRISANTANISALTDALEDVTCRVKDTEETLSAHTDQINAISGDVESLKESATTLFEQDEFISGVVDNLLEEIEKKADKGDSYLKDETYSQEEIDNIVTGINSEMDSLEEDIKHWVEDKGYATKEYVDATFETKEEAAVQHNVLDEKINGEIERSVAKDTELENSISSLSDKLDEVKEKHDEDVQELKNKDTELEGKIGELESGLIDLAAFVDTKASQEDLDETNENVARISGDVASKVEQSEFDAYKQEVSSEFSTVNSNIADLYTNKADKSDLNVVSAAVNDVADDLAQEIQDRKDADERISDKVDELTVRVESVELSQAAQDRAIQGLRDDLNQEIADREDADNALIGTPDDASDMDTINAAKNYAKGLVTTTSGANKAYTDEKITSLKNEIEDEIERQSSEYATKEYVQGVANDINNSVDQKVGDEAATREANDLEIMSRVNRYTEEITQDLQNTKNALHHTASVLKAVTEWEGETPEGYEDDGNGILDVLHREFHNFKNSMTDTVSGINETLVTHVNNEDIHVTAEDKARWDAGGGEISSALTAHTSNTVIHVTAQDRARWDAAGSDHDVITAHTASTTMHVTANDKNNWNNKVDPSDISGFIDGVEYVVNGTSHNIVFYHGSTQVDSINANDFIKDGMVDNVALVDNSLVITFNTDAGKEAITIPLIEIFDPSNYYDKSAVDAMLATKADKTEIPTNLSELNNDTDFITARVEGTTLILG